MSQVTPQTVEIKKSPRSTFNKNRIKRGSARIGKLNVVEHLMMEPSDMVRCQVSTKILFISPLSVPAFAEMDVYTYYFFDAYQNVCTDFNDIIQNYTHETKQDFEGGVLVNKSGYKLPYAELGELSSYICQGLHWSVPYNSPAIVVPPFGDPNSYDTGFLAKFVNYRMQYEFCFSSYEQKKDISQLLNQFDIPYGALLPLSKDFQNWFAPPNSSVNSDPSFDWSNLTGYEKALYELPFSQYWSRELNFASTGYQVIRNYVTPGQKFVNILPFKCYQHIINDWFLDTMKNLPIDLFKNTIYHSLGSNKFTRRSSVDLDNYAISQGFDRSIVYNEFRVRLFSHEDNYLFNSLFSIRSPWYTKDYFNTQTNDPTLGVSPYAVGTSILDLRKNSALQRLAEKKALCGNKFVDFIAQHFNYYPPELDISRSIHLGTSVQTVDVTQVLQTSETTSQSAQGERAATAQSYGRSKGVFFKAPTYGEFLVLQCVKPKIDYYNGLPREMQIVDVADMPLPELSQIGFDSCFNSELFVNPAQPLDGTFGYVPRYSWRKTSLNRIYGELCNTLNYWHQSPDLKYGATLNWNFGQIGFENHDSSFAYANSDTRVYSPSFNRIFAIQDASEDTYVYQHNIRLTLNTCLPTNDSPQL